MTEINSITCKSKTRNVKAVRLTRHNIPLLGVEYHLGFNSAKIFVHNRVGVERDWFVFDPKTGPVGIFTDQEFLSQFETVSEAEFNKDEKFTEVLLLVKKAMKLQGDSSYYDLGNADEMDVVAVQTAREILAQF